MCHFPHTELVHVFFKTATHIQPLQCLCLIKLLESVSVSEIASDLQFYKNKVGSVARYALNVRKSCSASVTLPLSVSPFFHSYPSPSLSSLWLTGHWCLLLLLYDARPKRLVRGV